MSRYQGVEFDETLGHSYEPYAWGGTLLCDYISERDVDFMNITLDTPVAQSASRITTAVQPGTYSWPLWKFWTVAVTLTFGSIILPLLAPRAYRSAARFSRRRRRTFRMIVSFIWVL